MKKIVLCDTNQALIACWKYEFAGLTNVEVHQGSALEHHVDALVSPANSFGFMDGGYDYLLTQVLGEHVQKRLQQEIANLPEKELLVGKTLTVPTDHETWPYLISAPTMRVPMVLGNTSVNAYLAALAVFIELRTNPNISSICMTGLGTGVGKVPFDVCARQMREAYGVAFHTIQFPNTWHDAQTRHQRMCLIQPRDLQKI